MILAQNGELLALNGVQGTMNNLHQTLGVTCMLCEQFLRYDRHELHVLINTSLVSVALVDFHTFCKSQNLLWFKNKTHTHSIYKLNTGRSLHHSDSSDKQLILIKIFLLKNDT